VSERHTLVVALAGVALTLLLFQRWSDWLAKLRIRLKQAGSKSMLLWFPPPSYIFLAAFITLTVIGVARSLRPLHENRRFEREAGEWFVQHAEPGDILVDPYGFASFYAETVPELADKSKPAVAPKRRFLLVEPEDRDKFRCGIIAQWSAGSGLGEKVKSWPDAGKPKLVVYRAKLGRS